MPRTCFGITPFSTTKSCAEEQLTEIFANVFKPSIEEAGFDYPCGKSNATKGNIIGAIIRDLDESHIIFKDITDQNPNVV